MAECNANEPATGEPNVEKPMGVGGAGQPIHRRELFRKGVAGFAVVWVGQGAARADGEGGGGGQQPTCGAYAFGTLVGDSHCGITGPDASCGLPVNENEPSGPVGQDFDCDGETLDLDCGEPASAISYHSDSNCVLPPGEDLDCGLQYAGSETMSDADCQSGYTEDADCGKPAIGGGRWDDGTTGHS